VLPTLPAPMIPILMASSFPVAETLLGSEKDR